MSRELRQEALRLGKKLGHDLKEVEDVVNWLVSCKKCRLFVRIKEPCNGKGEPYLLGPAIVMPCTPQKSQSRVRPSLRKDKGF